MQNLLKRSLQLLSPSLIATIAIALPLTFLEEAMNHYLMDLAQKFPGVMIYLQIIMFMLGLIFSFAFLTLLPPVIYDISKGATPRNLTLHFQKYFQQLSIESLRGLPPVLWGFVKLIVPGIVEMLRLLYIPFVVQFDEEYDRGDVDALEKSRALVKGNFWFVFGAAFWGMVISMIPYFLPGDRNSQILSFIYFVILSWVVNVLSQVIATLSFVELEKRHRGV